MNVTFPSLTPKKKLNIIFVNFFMAHIFQWMDHFLFYYFPMQVFRLPRSLVFFCRIVSIKNHIHLTKTTLFQWCSQLCMEMHVSNANMYFDRCMELHFQLYLVNPTIFSGWLSFVKGVTRLCNWTTSCTTKNILVIIYSPWENPIVDEHCFI